MIKLTKYIKSYAKQHKIKEGEAKLRLALEWNVHFTTVYRWVKDKKVFVLEDKIIKLLN